MTELAPVETVTERKNGSAHVRDAEAYHLSGVAEQALFEGERLMTHVHRRLSEVYLSRNGNSDEFDVDAVKRQVEEALLCQGTAEHYLRMLLDAVRGECRDPWNERPF